MPTCTNCGAHVTDSFARVFGDNEDTVTKCMACAPYVELAEAPNREHQSTIVWE